MRHLSWTDFPINPDRRHFKSAFSHVTKLQPKAFMAGRSGVKPINVLLLVTKAGSDCFNWPLRTTEEGGGGEEEALRARLLLKRLAKCCVSGSSTRNGRKFHFKVQQRMALEAFVPWKIYLCCTLNGLWRSL